MSGTWKVGRLGGVPVGLHYSWLFFFALITWSLGSSFPDTFGVAPGVAWVAAAVTAVLFLVSVLGHELAHAWVALARGIPVKGITLFILGGAAEIEQEASRPLDELLITVVGPLASLGFGLGFGALALVGGLPAAVHAVAATLALVNISLALFNLIPGFPLDGGRILRAILWGALHDFSRATRIAARLGQFFGLAFIALGLYQFLVLQQGLSGLWTAGIGWYLQMIAQASYRQALLQQGLQGVLVSQVMRDRFAWVHSGTRVQDAFQHYFVQHPRPGLPVLRDGQLIGLVTLPQVRILDAARWPATPVDAIMTPLAQLPTLAPADAATHLLDLLQRRRAAEAAVLDDGRLVGLATLDDLQQTLLAHRPSRSGPVASPGISRS